MTIIDKLFYIFLIIFSCYKLFFNQVPFNTEIIHPAYL